MSDRLAFCGVVTLIGALIALAVLALWYEGKACSEKGGKLRSFSGVGPAMSAQGGVAITTTTFCLSSDGRVL